jgi:capsid protein
MIYVIDNQSVLDAAIQESGSVMAAFDWALKNGVSITDNLEPGQQLNTPTSGFVNADVAGYFKGKKQMVATGMKKPPNPPGLGTGIGFMQIGLNFKIG